MKPNDLIEYYKGEVKAAAEIGVSVTTVRNWIASNKIPRLKQYAIQALTKNKLKAD